MDGNNRWGKIYNLGMYDTYDKGAKNLLKLTEHIFKNYEVKTVSAFALSLHNLKRSKTVVSSLIKVLDHFTRQLLNDFNHSFKISFIGDFSFLPKNIILKLHKIEKMNNSNTKKLVIFLNYSGKVDILNAITKLIKKKVDINDKNFKKFLLTNSLSDPDLIIRTGGFNRLSDFMLYQSSFTELFFEKKLWPDFKTSNLDNIIKKFRTIKRKFGK